MRRVRKKLAIIVAACMMIFFAGSAFALTAGQFGGMTIPSNVTVTISNVHIPPGFSPGNPAPYLIVQAADVVGNQFIVEFDVNFRTPGQYIIVEFLVFNHTNQVLTITEVISNHADGNPLGIVVTQGGPMSAPGANVVPALNYGTITMTILWDENSIDWNYFGITHRIDGTFDFSTLIRFDQTVTPTPTNTPTPTATPPAPPPPPTPTPDHVITPVPTPAVTPAPPIDGGNGGADNGGADDGTGDNDGQDQDQDQDQGQDADPPADGVVAPDDPNGDNGYADGNGGQNGEANNDNNDSDANDTDVRDEDADADIDADNGYDHDHENPLTGDNFSNTWLIITLAGFGASAAVLALLVVASRKQAKE